MPNLEITQTCLTLQGHMVSLVRSFGLLQTERTPCGQPVSITEAHVLMELEKVECLLQGDLIWLLHLEKSTISRLVTQMERRAWIERVRDPDDRRSVILKLTEKGRHMASSIAEARQAKFAQLYASIPANARERVLESLAILVEAMNEKP